MNTTLTLTQTAALPRVNLMPDDYRKAQQQRRIQGGLALLVLLAAGGAFLWDQHEAHSVGQARAALQRVQSQNDSLIQQQNKLAYVTRLENQADAASSTLSSVMANEVLWSRYLEQFGVVTPKDVYLKSMEIQENPPQAGTSASAASSVGSVPLATITFTGNATNHNAVADWLDALSKVHGFIQPTFTSSTEIKPGQPTVTFTSQVLVDADALSHRWTTTGAAK
jgi:Tfp pilus assembly protein PilN